MVRRNGSRVRCLTKAAQDVVASPTTRNAELAKAKPGKPATDHEVIRAEIEAKAEARAEMTPARAGEQSNYPRELAAATWRSLNIQV